MKELFERYIGSPICWAGIMLSGGIAIVNAVMLADSVLEFLFNLTLAAVYTLLGWFGVGVQLAVMIIGAPG